MKETALLRQHGAISSRQSKHCKDACPPPSLLLRGALVWGECRADGSALHKEWWRLKAASQRLLRRFLGIPPSWPSFWDALGIRIFSLTLTLYCTIFCFLIILIMELQGSITVAVRPCKLTLADFCGLNLQKKGTLRICNNTQTKKKLKVEDTLSVIHTQMFICT